MKLHALILVCLLGLVGCAGRSPSPESPPVTAEAGQIADLQTFSQNLQSYAQQAGANKSLLSDVEAAQENARFDKLFFSPWQQKKTSLKAKDIFAPLRSKAFGYAANLLPWTQAHWQEMLDNAQRSSFPALLRPAITVRSTSVRDMPSAYPRFDNPKKAGEGYPFDMAQSSTLALGTPVLVVHASQDKSWLLIETALVSGWVAAEDLAWVSPQVQATYTSGKYAVIIQDNVSLCNTSGNFLVQADLGSILPMVQTAPLTVLVPMRNPQGEAVLVPAQLTEEQAASKPLPLTAASLAKLGNALMGNYYGWGGLHGERDCSSTLRDVFAAVGVWLPRNSAAQAKAWDYQAFGDISPLAKEQRILAEAKPFATLLWLRGHITLYVGQVNGRAAMYHTIWGLRTLEGGVEGRYILGRTVITSTQPGVELPTIQDKNGLLARMLGMSILR